MTGCVLMPSPKTAVDKLANEVAYLFAYGTLKRGEPGHELMKDAQFVSVVMKTHLKWVHDAEYPSCVETDDATDYVIGEIWAVPMKDIPLLDDYEGQNYTRVQLKNSNLLAYVVKEDESDRFVETT